MRLPRRVICTAATAALFAATAVATPRGDAVAAGPAPGLCTMSTSRGAVPDDFSIEACVDGSSILLRNTLDVPMRFETEGDTADPVTVEINQTPAAVYTRSQEDRAGLLLPGDHMRIPIGSGEASVTLADTDAGGDYVLATTVQTFFPVGEAVNALTALVPELVDDLADHGNCLSGKNWLQQRGCDVLLARNVSFAIGRAGVSVAGNAAIKLVASTPTYLKFLAAQPSAIREILGSERTLVQREAAPVPVTFDALLTAPVPSLCDKPAGNLVDGILPGVPENEGGVWLFGIGWTPADDPSTRVMAVGDLTSDGADDAVVAIACFAGGVGWPTGVHLYGSTTRPTPEHLAHVVLADVFDLEWEHRESVEAIAVRDDRFTVDWATHAPGDPMCCPSLRVRGSFRWHDSSVETGDVEILQDTRLVSTIAPDSYPDPETCRRSDAPVASSGPDGAALAAMCFYQAFALDDAEMARRYAEATVVDSTFRIPWPIDPLSWVFHGCSTGPERPGWSNLGCTFTTSIPGGDDLVIDVAFAPQGNTMLISSIESAADYGD